MMQDDELLAITGCLIVVGLILLVSWMAVVRFDLFLFLVLAVIGWALTESYGKRS